MAGSYVVDGDAMALDHRAVNNLMRLLLYEVRLIQGNAVTAHNIRYLAEQARDLSGRYCPDSESP